MVTTQDPLVGLLYRLMDGHLPVKVVHDEVFQAGFDVEQGTLHMRHDGLAQTAEKFAEDLRESAKKAASPKRTVPPQTR